MYNSTEDLEISRVDWGVDYLYAGFVPLSASPSHRTLQNHFLSISGISRGYAFSQLSELNTYRHCNIQRIHTLLYSAYRIH